MEIGNWICMNAKIFIWKIDAMEFKNAYKSIKKNRLFYWISFDLKISVHCHYNPFCHSIRKKKETTEAHFDGLHAFSLQMDKMILHCTRCICRSDTYAMCLCAAHPIFCAHSIYPNNLYSSRDSDNPYSLVSIE